MIPGYAKKMMWILAGAILVLCAAYWFAGGVRPAGEAPTPQQGTSVANPASVNCVQTLGGQLEIADSAQGAVGYCHLQDGRVCEEWALLRDGSCMSPQ